MTTLAQEGMLYIYANGAIILVDLMKSFINVVALRADVDLKLFNFNSTGAFV